MTIDTTSTRPAPPHPNDLGRQPVGIPDEGCGCDMPGTGSDSGPGSAQTTPGTAQTYKDVDPDKPFGRSDEAIDSDRGDSGIE